MKYLIGLLLVVSSMVSTAQEKWYLGTWVIDVEKTKEHSQHHSDKQQELVKLADSAAKKGFYEVKEDFFKLYSIELGVGSPEFYYEPKETDRETIHLDSEALHEPFEFGKDAYGVYLLMIDTEYQMQDEKFGAKSYMVDENGERIKEEVTIKAYLKEYDQEIDREHYDNYKKDERYK